MNDDSDHRAPRALSLRDHLQIRRNAIGLALMLAGVLTFITFHFVRIHDNHGWYLWVGLIEFIRSKEFIRNTEGLLGYSGFITLSIGTLISPFLFTWMIHNPWLKWCLAALATMAAGIMWYFTAQDGGVPIFLLAHTPTFTLAGLLCITTVPRLPVHPSS